MKKILLSLTVMGAVICPADAQYRTKKLTLEECVKQYKQALHRHMSNQGAAHKTTAMQWRLIANSFYHAGAGAVVDSNRFYYSKGRGSKHDFEFSYNDNYYTLSEDPENIRNMSPDSSVNYAYDGSSLKRTRGKEYTYDATGKVLALKSNDVTFYTIDSLTYLPSGKVNTVTTSDTFDGGILTHRLRLYAVYDTKDERTEDSTYDLQGNFVSYKNIYTHDARGNTTSTTGYEDDGTALVPYFSSSMMYDNQDRTIRGIYETDNGTGLQPVVKDTFIYSGAQKHHIEHVSQMWNGNNWENTNRIVYTLNGQGKADTAISYVWQNNKWELNGKEVFRYNSIDLQESIHFYLYNNSTGQFNTQPGTISRQYYENYFPESVTDVAATRNVVLYPNPVTDKLLIHARENYSELYIYNVNGQQVLHSKISDSRTAVDVQSLSPGNYIISILDAQGGNIAKQQFTKL